MLVFSSNRENFKLRLEGMLGFIDVQGSEGFDDSKRVSSDFVPFIVLLLSCLSILLAHRRAASELTIQSISSLF